MTRLTENVTFALLDTVVDAVGDVVDVGSRVVGFVFGEIGFVSVAESCFSSAVLIRDVVDAVTERFFLIIKSIGF